MKNKSLYKITSEYIDIEMMLLESEGELTPEINQMLEINKIDLNKKSEGYISIINKLNSEIDFIDAEVKRLNELKKMRKNAQNRLKNAISNAMQIYDIEKIELPLNKISFRKSESIEVNLPIEELPKKVQKLKIELINKNEIKKMLKSGEKIKGIELVENKNLQIK